MTIHSAKGLEFEYIFVTGLEENLFPHSRSYLDPEEMEEERRLAYVAFTRAKKQLFLSLAQERFVFGNKQASIMSRFIEELPEELLEFVGEPEFDDDTNALRGWNEKSEAGSNKNPSRPDHSSSTSRSQASDVKPGDRVKSEYFGKGTILSIDDDVVRIRFDTRGTKELATEYAKLARI
jgi:DNA helicase-2/ATP-dependent DNA helicase PcrA